MARSLVTWAALGLAVSGGCASQLQPIADGGTDGGGEAMPAEVAAAFERACGTPACHGGAQGPSLTAANAPAILGASAAAGGLPLVVPGDLQASYIAIKMLPDAQLDDPSLRVGGIMPVPGSSFDEADITTILDWIATAPAAGSSGGDATGDPTGGGDATTGGDGSTGTPVPQLCGIQDVAPGVTSTVVMGDGVDVMPTQIGLIIETNCGCHLAAATELISGAPPPAAPVPEGTGTDFTTLAGIRANTEGVALRINNTASAMPPPYYCAEQDIRALSQEDFVALASWLSLGAPDGATWTGG